MAEDDFILRPHGSYRDLKAYQNSEIIHDATVAFCRRFLRYPDRTIDQMVQAARSGKQNIAEGSSMSGTSKASELKLTGVARASLEELRVDYEDFLRQNGFARWPKDHAKAKYVRNLAYKENRSYDTYRRLIEDKSSETAANTMICLILQTTYLLDRLKTHLAEALVNEGGVNERIYRERRTRRGY